MSRRVTDLLETARDIFRGESNPIASREALIDTGRKLIATMIAENYAKHKKARSRKGMADWTFPHEIAGIPVKNMNRLTYGNLKLKGIMIFDLPAVTTCPSCADCKKACYAVASQEQYPMTMVFRWQNLMLYLLASEHLAKAIDAQIMKRSRGYTHFRIHSSGDFFDADYTKWWFGIIQKTRWPGRFYAYSKAESVVDLSSLTTVGLNILTSYLPPDNRLNFTPSKKPKGIAEAKEMLRRTNEAGAGAIICPATVRKAIKCGETKWGGHCTHCLTHRYTVFVRH